MRHLQCRPIQSLSTVLERRCATTPKEFSDVGFYKNDVLIKAFLFWCMVDYFDISDWNISERSRMSPDLFIKTLPSPRHSRCRELSSYCRNPLPTNNLWMCIMNDKGFVTGPLVYWFNLLKLPLKCFEPLTLQNLLTYSGIGRLYACVPCR